MDSYRSDRPPDRGRERFDAASRDAYPPTRRPRSRSPGGFRRRSRSPPRGPVDSFRGRARSPLRRYDAAPPPREFRARSPPRNDFAPTYGDTRSVPRPRSPPPSAKRGPEGSTAYNRRSRSPPRFDERSDPFGGRRRISPSPRSSRGDFRASDGSGRESGAPSRRSSPRPLGRRPGDEYQPADSRNTPSAASYRSPPRRRDSPPPVRPRSPYRAVSDTYDTRSQFPPERTFSARNEFPMRDAPAPEPSAPYAREPPTGPASYGRAPPPGPSALTPSVNYGSRTSNGPPPSGPLYRGEYRGRGGPPPPPRNYPPARDPYPPPPPRGRGGYPPSGSYGRGGHGPPRDHYDSRPVPHEYRPSHGPAPPYSRAGSSSTTYPRSQRFNSALADLPSPKPGGEKLPPLHSTEKAERLEEEAARLRKLIDEKETKKRGSSREWDNGQRETSTAALRSELAEKHLRSLNGEGEVLELGMGAAF